MKPIRNLRAIAPIALMALILVAGETATAKAADVTLTMCSPNGSTDASRTVQSRVPGVAALVADANGCVVFDVTTDSGGKGMAALLNQGFVIQNIAKPIIGTGISATGGGYKHLRLTTSPCSTSGVAGNACAEPTMVMSPAFADTNFTAICTCVGAPTGVPAIRDVLKAAGGLQPEVAALTAATASCTEVDCVAVHD